MWLTAVYHTLLGSVSFTNIDAKTREPKKA